MKTKHILLAAGGLIGLGLLCRYGFRYHDRERNMTSFPDEPDINAGIYSPVTLEPEDDMDYADPGMEDGYTAEEAAAEVPLIDEFPLQLGSNGPRVERLQIWLMRNYGYTKPISGILDEHTLCLMRKYLKAETLDEQAYHDLGMAMHVCDQPRKY